MINSKHAKNFYEYYFYKFVVTLYVSILFLLLHLKHKIIFGSIIIILWWGTTFITNKNSLLCTHNDLVNNFIIFSVLIFFLHNKVMLWWKSLCLNLGAFIHDYFHRVNLYGFCFFFSFFFFGAALWKSCTDLLSPALAETVYFTAPSLTLGISIC